MKTNETIRAAWRLIADFGRDESGAVMAYVAVISLLLLGFVGMAVDFGRIYTTNSQAQAAADAAALAGATQLDGQAGAIARATSAAQTSPLVTNDQDFASGGPVVHIASVRFLSSLPASDDDPITASYETTADESASYIEVTTEVLTQQNTFLRAVGINIGTTKAVAVAGFRESVCKIPPLMICNPWETSTSDEINYAWLKGKTLLVKTKEGGTTAWASGDMGLLDPPTYDWDTSTNTGAKQVALSIARVSPPFCFDDPVSVRPGQVDSMRNAINVMFDMYQNPYFGAGVVRTDPNFRPALNVTKGYVSTSACDAVPADNDTIAMGLPPDTCFADTTDPNWLNFTNPTGCNSSSIDWMNNVPLARRDRIGDGVWDILRYWKTNHDPSATSVPSDCVTDYFDNTQTVCIGPNASRYDMYRYEIAKGIIPDNKTGAGSTGRTDGELGAPQCYGGGSPIPALPDRRVLYMAVVNCLAEGVQGNSVNVVHPRDYVKMFIIRPIRGGSDTNLWLEFIGPVEPGSKDAGIHDLVQLYR